jgi:succinate dehydrogenase/fumarate reductase flavoprotein subunit
LLLTETAKVYKQLGDVERGKKEFKNALSFYTQGIGVKCKDDLQNAQLYFARSLSHLLLGEPVICFPVKLSKLK